MYFVLSKLLLFIITPFYWVLGLLGIAAFTKNVKSRRWTSYSGVIIFILFSNSWLFNLAAHCWDFEKATLLNSAHYSCVIVLGGFVSTDDGKEGHFNKAADRFTEGVKLFKEGKASHILITGGNSSLIPTSFSEGEWCRKELQKLHIPDSAILIEGKARNTVENAKFSARIINEKGLEPPYLLVTSADHMRRAKMLFEKNKLPVVPYPCIFRTAPLTWPVLSDAFPDTYVILAWGGFFKEVTGYLTNKYIN